MGCEDRSLSCRLDLIAGALDSVDVWASYVIPVLGIAATLMLGIAALRAATAANRIAKQNLELLERDERRRVADAVLDYYRSRSDDILSGSNGNMPHWTDAIDAAAAQTGAPNWQHLRDWLTTAIDHTIDDSPPHHRDINALHLREMVPVVVSRWVGDPKGFSEPAWQLWDERRQPS